MDKDQINRFDPDELLQEGKDVVESLANMLLRSTRETDAGHSKVDNPEVVLITKRTKQIAHDFNNLLNVVAGNLELLTASMILAPNQTKRVEDCLTAIERGVVLVQQLATIADEPEPSEKPDNANNISGRMDQSEIQKKELDPASIKLLVVEDDPELRKVAVTMLTRLGYDIVEVADGTIALRLLEKSDSLDLLFTDVVLPHGISGIDVAEATRKKFPQLKVIFTSGYVGDEKFETDLLDNRVEFLSKPYRQIELAQCLHRLLAN